MVSSCSVACSPESPASPCAIEELLLGFRTYGRAGFARGCLLPLLEDTPPEVLAGPVFPEPCFGGMMIFNGGTLGVVGRLPLSRSSVTRRNGESQLLVSERSSSIRPAIAVGTRLLPSHAGAPVAAAARSLRPVTILPPPPERPEKGATPDIVRASPEVVLVAADVLVLLVGPPGWLPSVDVDDGTEDDTMENWHDDEEDNDESAGGPPR